MGDGQVKPYSFSTGVTVAPDPWKNRSRRLPWLFLTGLCCSVCRAGVFGVLPWVCLGQRSLPYGKIQKLKLIWLRFWWHGWLKKGLFVPPKYQNTAVCGDESWWGRTVSLLSHVRLQLLTGESTCAEGLETTAVWMRDGLPGHQCSFLCQVTSLPAMLASAGCGKRFYGW